ncbi:YvcK family protein [Candidatus Woesearchaeota archaeon]|jgi:uncharacterized cofD-like protein|nr:YvcK family protein [Candidatus Woesearchaeota archaeon]
MKKIVVIGGGSGIFNLLRGLKKKECKVTAIVSMMDSGGSTGVLRDEYGILPPGDVRKCLVALSESSELMKDLFQYRFPVGGLKGHSFGNLFLTALTQLTGSEEQAILEAGRVLKIKGLVIPVTLDKCNLCAELENGAVVKGETNIDVPKHDPNLKIDKMFLEPGANAHYGAIKAIEYADLVVIGPGDLYSSLVPNLLVKGISDALQKSSATKIYVCNLMTKHGESTGFCASDFLRVVKLHSGVRFDHVICNDFSQVILPRETLDKYAKEKAYPVVVDFEKLKFNGINIISKNLLSNLKLLRHDPKKISDLIYSLIN